MPINHSGKRGVCDILGYLKMTDSKLIFLSEPGSYWEESCLGSPRGGVMPVAL